MIQFDRRRYRLTGITPLLGSQPANPDVRGTYIASKAPTEEMGDAETGMLPEDRDKGLTVFLRRETDDALCIMDYVLGGYFKGAVKAMAHYNKVKQAESKVGLYVFVNPRVIPIMRNDEPVYEEDGELQRSLRAQTMQGPRTTWTGSEMVNAPWSIEFEVELMDNDGTPKSAAITWGVIEGALDYGRLKGLGQWRNGGYGRFSWERINA